jgi:excisionase family DNA binding protein
VKLLTVDEASALLGEKPAWVYGRVRSGELPAVKVGKYVRFRPDVIEAWCVDCPATSGEHGVVAAFIAEAKRGQSCADCGRRDELHFHHVDPASKTTTVSRTNTIAAARREIAKCVLLCPACHRARHQTVSRTVSPNAENGAQLSATESAE